MEWVDDKVIISIKKNSRLWHNSSLERGFETEFEKITHSRRHRDTFGHWSSARAAFVRSRLRVRRVRVGMVMSVWPEASSNAVDCRHFLRNLNATISTHIAYQPASEVINTATTTLTKGMPFIFYITLKGDPDSVEVLKALITNVKAIATRLCWASTGRSTFTLLAAGQMRSCTAT